MAHAWCSSVGGSLTTLFLTMVGWVERTVYVGSLTRVSSSEHFGPVWARCTDQIPGWGFFFFLYATAVCSAIYVTLGRLWQEAPVTKPGPRRASLTCEDHSSVRPGHSSWLIMASVNTQLVAPEPARRAGECGSTFLCILMGGTMSKSCKLGAAGQSCLLPWGGYGKAHVQDGTTQGD